MAAEVVVLVDDLHTVGGKLRYYAAGGWAEEAVGQHRREGAGRESHNGS